MTATIPTTIYTIPAMINLFFPSKTNQTSNFLDRVNNNTTTRVKVRLLEGFLLVNWWKFNLIFKAGTLPANRLKSNDLFVALQNDNLENPFQVRRLPVRFFFY